jgi:hypothetical protein
MDENVSKPEQKPPTMGDMEPGQMARMMKGGYREEHDVVIRVGAPKPGWYHFFLNCFWASDIYPDIANWPVEILPKNQVIELRNEQ